MQHDGSLKLPAGGGAVELAHLYRVVPGLPMVQSDGQAWAERLMRERVGAVTPQLKEQIRGCFEAEAGGVQLGIVIPELYARDLMLSDPLFQVRPPFHVHVPAQHCPTSSTYPRR